MPHDAYSYEDMVKEAVRGGASLIQFRAKELTTREIYETGKKLLKISKENGTVFIIDDKLEVAVALKADGVHLGSDDLPLDEAKKIVNEMISARLLDDFIIGYSTHSVEEAISSATLADYISIGPIFETPAKPIKPLGTDVIKEIKQHVKIPVVAIGGIDQSNVRAVLDAGADAVAVIRSGCGAKNIYQSVQELKKAITL